MKNLLLISIVLLSTLFSTAQTTTLEDTLKSVALINANITPEQLAQQQLNAYNGHNLEAFLAPYAEDVKVYTFPNKLNFEGKATMRKNYQFIEQNPDLHCELVNRIVEGDTVIDHENVTVSKDRPPFKAIAIYKIKDGKIAEVYFIQ